MTALLLPAVGGLGGETGVALAADDLVAVVSLGEKGEGGIVDPATEAEHEVQCRLLLDAEREARVRESERERRGREGGSSGCTWAG